MNEISWIFTSSLNFEDYYQCLHKCKIIFDLENHLEIKMKGNMLARFIICNTNLINRLFLTLTYFLLINTKLSIASICSAPAYDYQFQSIFPMAKTALPSSGFCQSGTLPKSSTEHHTILRLRRAVSGATLTPTCSSSVLCQILIPV